jgi:periplasmic protein TonB
MMALKKNPRFDLKLHYRRTLEIGMVCSLCLLLAAFRYFPEYHTEKVKGDEKQIIIKAVDIPITQQTQLPPPPPRPVVLVEVPNTIDDPPIEIPEFNPKANVPLPPPPFTEKDKPERVPEFYPYVEEPPTIIGGIEALNKIVVYPELAIKANVQGQVLVEAFIDENGNVVNVELRKGLGAGCDDAAINAVRSVKFNPGKQRGRAVKVRVSVPIIFKLK